MRFLLPFLVLVSGFASAEDAPSPRFVRNDGQWDADILYRAALPGGFLFLKQQSLHYVFYHTGDVARQHPHTGHDSRPAARAAAAPVPAPAADRIRAHGLEVAFLGSQPDASLHADRQRPEMRNFFLGDEPARWASNVPAFAEVRYQNLYPGVDLRLFAQNGTFKYEFIVAPGTDPAVIRMKYAGMDGLRLENGFLLTETSVNKMTEMPPFSYQADKAGIRQEVPSAFRLQHGVVSFAFPEGHRRQAPLVIDPVLVFSTYSGSFSDNWGFTATYDADGHLYSGGIEFGNRFPSTTGAFQTTFSGQVDVAILKYTPDGKALRYATYLGGTQADVPHSLIVNAAGELVILGTTSSLNFPATPGAHDRTFNGGTGVSPVNISFVNGSDLFVAKLSPAADRLLGATYLGGSQNDGLNTDFDQEVFNYGDEFRGEIYTDAAGSIYLASTTTSRNFPVAGNASVLRGLQDAVVCQFNPALTTLAWSTYLGGNGFDAVRGIRVGASGAVYVAGGTTSTDLPATAGVLKRTLGGSEDGFTARFLNRQLTHLSYIGTNAADQCYLLDLDKDENVYLLGLTFGSYPVTAGVYSNPDGKQFMHALDATLSRTVFSTTLGSGRPQPDISPTAFMRSDCGFIYLAGWGGAINNLRGVEGSSTDGLPVTADALRRTTNGDDYYLAIFDKGVSKLLYGTFFGSPDKDNHVDGGTSRFSPDGTVYHAVCACRDNSRFPTTPGAWSNRNNGDVPQPPDTPETPNDGCNNAAFKINLDALTAAFDLQSDSCGVPASVRLTNKSQGGTRFEWLVNGQLRSSAAQTQFTFDTPGEYTVMLRAYNPLTCKQVDSVSKKVVVGGGVFGIGKDTTLCPGGRVRLLASGGVTYQWSPATGLDNPQAARPVAAPVQTTTYTVRITSAAGCVKTLSTTVSINNFTPDFEVVMMPECGKPTRLQLNALDETGRISWELTGEGPARPITDTLTLGTPGKVTEYEIVMRVLRGGCEQRVTRKVSIDDPRPPVNVITGTTLNTRFETYKRGWKVEIYDQWGRPIYANDTYQNDWTAPGIKNTVLYYKLTSPAGLSCRGWLHVMRGEGL